VVAFGDGGAELLSEPINDLLKPIIDTIIAGWVSTGLYELDGVVGSTAAVFSRESEYTLMRSYTEWPLVFNENTKAWTEWRYHPDAGQSYPYTGLFDFARTGRVNYSLGVSRYETRLSTTTSPSTLSTYARMDGSQAVTASAYSAGTGALTLSGAAYCLADDVIEDAAGKLWRVVNDVAGSVTLYLDGLEIYGAPGSAADFTLGACTLYRALRCRVAPQPFYGEPFTAKCNETATVMFSRFDGPHRLYFAYLSQLSPVTALNTVVGRDDWTEEAQHVHLLNGAAPFVTGFAANGVVPNAHARSWLMSAGVRWVQTHGHARLEGIYLHSREMDSRARQQVAV
jgi:hypothetical protein